MPDPSEIDYMEEPMVSAEIMVTTEFVGSIMKLCQERRGVYNGMEYIEQTRALLKYDLPLNEIIYDFFDALKSRSRGYASFDYEMKGYENLIFANLIFLLTKKKSMHFHLLYLREVPRNVAVRCVKNSKERFPDSSLRFLFRQQSEAG